MSVCTRTGDTVGQVIQVIQWGRPVSVQRIHISGVAHAGLHRLNADIPNESKEVQAGIIWSITALATISVVSGVKVGIRRLSEINWLLAQFIAFVFLFQENTWYLLNVLVQSLGFYLQWLVQLGSWCNAFVNSPAGARPGLRRFKLPQSLPQCSGW